MQTEKFYIQKVKHRENSLSTITLSSKGERGAHFDVIKIHGTRQEVTERAIKILEALNGSQ